MKKSIESQTVVYHHILEKQDKIYLKAENLNKQTEFWYGRNPRWSHGDPMSHSDPMVLWFYSDPRDLTRVFKSGCFIYECCRFKY